MSLNAANPAIAIMVISKRAFFNVISLKNCGLNIYNDILFNKVQKKVKFI